MPRKAIVLAAGLGVRLRPFTLFLPKPLLPVGGEPLIERTLRQLESWGVEEIAVNLHWQAPLLRDYLARRRGSARIVCSHEPCILGTGGALRPLRDFIGGLPFWLVNADILWRVSPRLLWRPFCGQQALAALWLVPDRGPRTVETDAAGTIATFRSARPGGEGTATFSGVQVVSPAILDFLPARAACSVVELYEAAAAAGRRVIGVVASGRSRWADAGLAADYPRLCGAGRGGGKAAAAAPCFRLARGGRSWFPAQTWPDAALAPALLRLGWPLAGSEAEPLAARGSDRVFLRLRHGRHTAIYVRHGTERRENARYAAHARLLLAAGVSVPRVLVEMAEARALVIEDAGRRCLRDIVQASPGLAEELYRAIMPVVARLHGEATGQAMASGHPLEPPFDGPLYRWERDLLLTQIVRGRHGLMQLPSGIEEEYDLVARRLLSTPRAALVHRDLQSTNIMVRGRRLLLIDFQGMRLGAAAYDLASLLCDPYVCLAPALRRRLLDVYAAHGASHAAACRDFAWAAVQRLTQALGAYGRLTALGLTGWERYIEPASRLLAGMAEECGLNAIAALARATAERERMRGARGN